MKKKEESPKKTASLPASIVSFYSKYKNTSTTIRSQVIMGTKFEIDDRYEIIDTSNFLFWAIFSLFCSVGQGAYGVVVAAKDKKAKDPENDLVAIKKIEKAFEHKVFTKRTLRELKMLRLLAHENVRGLFFLK